MKNSDLRYFETDDEWVAFARGVLSVIPTIEGESDEDFFDRIYEIGKSFGGRWGFAPDKVWEHRSESILQLLQGYYHGQKD